MRAYSMWIIAAAMTSTGAGAQQLERNRQPGPRVAILGVGAADAPVAALLNAVRERVASRLEMTELWIVEPAHMAIGFSRSSTTREVEARQPGNVAARRVLRP